MVNTNYQKWIGTLPRKHRKNKMMEKLHKAMVPPCGGWTKESKAKLKAVMKEYKESCNENKL